MTYGDLEEIISELRTNFHQVLLEEKITRYRCYNSDQTGIFYHKFPSRLCVYASENKYYTRVKQIKGKVRVTLKVWTACSGSKVPLSIIGNANTPACFYLSTNGIPPMKYKDQKNDFFDKKITTWWIFCFWPYNSSQHSYLDALLILEKCTAHNVDMSQLTKGLTIILFPPNMASNHQPSDMGMIASMNLEIRYLWWGDYCWFLTPLVDKNNKKSSASDKGEDVKDLLLAEESIFWMWWIS